MVARSLHASAPHVLARPSLLTLTHTYSCFSSRRQQRPGGGGGGGVGGGGGGGGGPKSHNPQQQQPQQHQHHQHQQVPQHFQQQQQTTNQTHQFVTELQSEGFNPKHGHGGRGYQIGQQGRGHHHGYSQNRRWHQQQRQPGPRNAKDTDNVKEEVKECRTDNAGGDENKNDGKTEKVEGGRVSLLQSSKERLRRRLKEKVSRVFPDVDAWTF